MGKGLWVSGLTVGLLWVGTGALAGATESGDRLDRRHGMALWAESLPLEPLQPASEPLEPLAPPGPPSTAESAPGATVALTLADFVSLVLAGNRDLQNVGLGRIVQRQALTAAEQTFDPRFTPIFEVGASRQWTGSEVAGEGATGDGVFGSPLTSRESRAVLQANVTTRQGTRIEVEADPLTPDRLLNVEIQQPLLRDFGTAINEAPVEQARLEERRNQLALEATVIDLITTATTRYTDLISAQAQVDIQAQSLGRRQRQLEILQALVAAGREAPINLLDTERAVADAERSLVEAQNALAQANNALLNLIGTDQAIRFMVNSAAVEALFQEATAQAAQYEVETLIAQAFRLRRDYQRAQLERQQMTLDLRLAENDLRWQVNAVAEGSVGDIPQTRLGLVATRTFEEPQFETNRLRSAIRLQQQDNSLRQQEDELRNDVTTRLADVRSTQFQVEAAERATLSARRQLEAAQEQYRLGRDTVGLSSLITQEEQLVEAETNALDARIAFLNRIALLEQTVGLTLERWVAQGIQLPLAN